MYRYQEEGHVGIPSLFLKKEATKFSFPSPTTASCVPWKKKLTRYYPPPLLLPKAFPLPSFSPSDLYGPTDRPSNQRGPLNSRRSKMGMERKKTESSSSAIPFRAHFPSRPPLLVLPGPISGGLEAKTAYPWACTVGRRRRSECLKFPPRRVLLLWTGEKRKGGRRGEKKEAEQGTRERVASGRRTIQAFSPC